MRPTLTGPLEARPNPSRWASLLDLALPALEHALPDERDALSKGSAPRWTLGGGTALALRIGHRISDDIDIFLSGVPLKAVSPGGNPIAKQISEKFDWPGHYVKYHRPDGEIDFLSSALQTSPGFSLETFRGQTIALETVDEVMVKKLRYRSTTFTLRDAFDLACVLKAKPETILTLAAEVADAIPRATLAITSLSNEKVRSAVRPMPAFADILDNPIDQAKAGFEKIAWLHENPLPEKTAEAIYQVVRATGWFEPGSRDGRVRFDWASPSHEPRPDILATFLERPIEAKAAILAAWRASDAKAFEAWDRGGRLAAKGSRTIKPDDKGIEH